MVKFIKQKQKLWLMKRIMSKYLKKLLPIIFLGLCLGLVVWFTKPPASLTNTNIFQFLLFFIPLFFLLTFIFNLFFNFFLRSLILSLGIILLLIFKSLDLLNFVSSLLTILATILLIISFKKPKVFQQSKIKSLKLKKQH